MLSGDLLYHHRLEIAAKGNIKTLMTTIERLVLCTTM
nr:MAG TPA: hypothetical protein [Bacteriophage sp.]